LYDFCPLISAALPLAGNPFFEGCEVFAFTGEEDEAVAGLDGGGLGGVEVVFAVSDKADELDVVRVVEGGDLKVAEVFSGFGCLVDVELGAFSGGDKLLEGAVDAGVEEFLDDHAFVDALGDDDAVRIGALEHTEVLGINEFGDGFYRLSGFVLDKLDDGSDGISAGVGVRIPDHQGEDKDASTLEDVGLVEGGFEVGVAFDKLDLAIAKGFGKFLDIVADDDYGFVAGFGVAFEFV
jgi:hypothetical protein